MLNLGPYSTNDYPNLRIHPTIVDRVLELAAVLPLIAAWARTIWIYINLVDKSMGNPLLLYSVLGTVAFVLIGVVTYLPIRFVRFPVRITQSNVATQFFLAIRFARVLNVFITLLFLLFVFNNVEGTYSIGHEITNLLIAVASALMALVFIAYYVLAFKYK